MRIKVGDASNIVNAEKVDPNFIYNRFDLFSNGDDFRIVKIQNGNSKKYVEYLLSGDTVELGLWLVTITEEELESLILYLLSNHPQIKQIIYKNALIPYGKAKAHNHFRIVFPDTVEEIENRISPKSRAKMRKKLLHAQEIYGEMQLLEYDRSNMPQEVVEKFFEFKLATRKRQYNLTPAEYLDRYHVSHCYVIKFGETYGAIRFSCEQCPIVYGENFTFNPELEKYSLGRAIFVHHLKRMVEKKHPQLFFAGGDYEYKTHYGSVEETLYDCIINVGELDISAMKERQSAKYRLIKRLKQFIK